MAEEIQIELKKHAYVYIEGISSNIGMDEMNNGQHAAYYFLFPIFIFIFRRLSKKLQMRFEEMKGGREK